MPTNNIDPDKTSWEEKFQEYGFVTKSESKFHNDNFVDGVLDPDFISQASKTDWEKKFDQYGFTQKEVNDKLKNNIPLSYSDLSWGKTLQNSLSNLPGDIAKTMGEEIQGLWTVITSPFITASAMKSFATGVAKRAIRGEGAYQDITEKDKELLIIQDTERALKDFFTTEEGFKKRIAERPYRTIYDLVTILTPLGKTGKIKYFQKKSPRLARATERVGILASALEPINLPASAARALVHHSYKIPGMKKWKNLPESLVKRALILSDEMPTERKADLIKIALKNKNIFNDASVWKLGDQISELDEIITKHIRMADIDPNTYPLELMDLTDGLDSLAKSLMKNDPIEGKQFYKEVMKVQKWVEDTHAANVKAGNISKEGFIRPLEAQKMKQTLNRKLENIYLKSRKEYMNIPAGAKAQKWVNQNIRDYIELMVPDIPINETKLTNDIIQKYYPGTRKLNLKEINKLQGSLIELRNAIAMTTEKVKKGSLFDFQVTAKAATGTAAGHFISKFILGGAGEALAPVGFTLGLGLGIVDSNPAIKQRIAVYLNELRGLGIDPKTTMSMTRMGLAQMADISNAPERVEEESAKKAIQQLGLIGLK